MLLVFFFFNDTATTEIYTLSLHDALPICPCMGITLMRILACCNNNNKIKRIVIISYLDGLGFAYKTIVRVQVQQCGYILLLRRVIRIQEYSSRSAHFHFCVRYCLLQTMDSKLIYNNAGAQLSLCSLKHYVSCDLHWC